METIEFKFNPGDPRLDRIQAAIDAEVEDSTYAHFLKQLLDYVSNGVTVEMIYAFREKFSKNHHYIVSIDYANDCDKECTDVRFNVEFSGEKFEYVMKNIEVQILWAKNVLSMLFGRFTLTSFEFDIETGDISNTEIRGELMCAVYLAMQHSKIPRMPTIWKKILGVDISIIDQLISED